MQYTNVNTIYYTRFLYIGRLKPKTVFTRRPRSELPAVRCTPHAGAAPPSLPPATLAPEASRAPLRRRLLSHPSGDGRATSAAALDAERIEVWGRKINSARSDLEHQFIIQRLCVIAGKKQKFQAPDK